MDLIRAGGRTRSPSTPLQDIQLVQGGLSLGVIYIALKLPADVGVALIDPRIRQRVLS